MEKEKRNSTTETSEKTVGPAVGAEEDRKNFEILSLWKAESWRIGPLSIQEGVVM